MTCWMPPVETLDYSWNGLMTTNPISRRALLHSAAAVPAALIRGYRFEPADGSGTELIRAAEKDLFR